MSNAKIANYIMKIAGKEEKMELGVIKMIGTGMMILGMAANVVSSWVDRKVTDAKIAEEVEKKVSERLIEQK